MGADLTVRTGAELATSTDGGEIFNDDLIREFVDYIDRSEKTTQTYLANLRQFLVWMRYTGCKEPKREDIISYREWLSREHTAIKADKVAGWTYQTDRNGKPVKVTCKPNTVSLYLRSVKQLFAWAAATGRYANVASNIHKPKIDREEHKKNAFELEELLKIENTITETAKAKAEAAKTAAKDSEGRFARATEQGKRLYAMYLLAVNAGLRTIELHRANVKDLEEKGGQMWLYVWGKGHSEPDRRRPIAREVADALKDYLKSRADGAPKGSPLFVSTGNRSGGRRIEARTISTMLKQAMRDAGFDSDRLTAHSLRHSTGTAIMQITGNNVYMAQSYMRHRDPKTTEIYLHTDTQKEEAKTAQQLYNRIHGKETAFDLNGLLARLTPLQAAQLMTAAASMAANA